MSQDSPNQSPQADKGMGDAFDPAMLQDDASDMVPTAAPPKPASASMGSGFKTAKPSGFSTGQSSFGSGSNYSSGSNTFGQGLPSDRYTDSRIKAEEDRYRIFTELTAMVVKTAVYVIVALIAVMVSIYTYVTLKSGALPDLSTLGVVFGHIVTAIREAFALGSR